jgi:hypothetical protein
MRTIEELRILPPLAIGRLGAAASPMDNYEVEVDPSEPLGFRHLRPSRTFLVNTKNGRITKAFVPKSLRFTEGSKVRPVAPFLEVWALTSVGQLQPLTKQLLATNGLSPGDVRWRLNIGNHKVYRRTGIANDKMDAVVHPFSDHTLHPILADCANFWSGKQLPLGWVQYINPTDEFPEIRLRFTPAHGYVYGSSATAPNEKPVDQEYVDVLYNSSEGNGTWASYADQNLPTITVPGGIYAQDDNGVSKGYLDDGCDGLVYVELDAGGGKLLSAYGRIGAGPPAYAPDSFPVRTVADELAQAMLGPEVTDEEATLEQTEEIVRRAAETVRLLNTRVMNGNTIDGRPRVASHMPAQDTNDTGRRYEPIMSPSLVDNLAVLNLHQNVITALRSGTAPWFADVLRDWDEIGDLTAKGRRKMPAMMRGADGRYMALTRRQIDLIRKVARRGIFSADEPLSGALSPPQDAEEKP